MNRTERATLERELRVAESGLASARERGQGVAAKVEARIAEIGGDVARLRTDDQLSALVAREETARETIAEATEKRDGLLRRLAESPIATAINGHDALSAGRGIAAGFNAQDLALARQRILSDAPGVVRLGPPPIVDPRMPQPLDVGGDSPRLGFQATAVDIGNAAFSAVPSYDLSQIFPYLRERPSVANLFAATPLDLYSKIFIRVSSPADQAAAVSEGGTKPTSSPTWDAVEVVPQIVAHIGSFTRQAFYNFDEFLNVISAEFMAGLLLAVDEELLTGDQSAPHLNGILHEPSINSITRDTTNEVRWDFIARAMTAVRTTAFCEPTAIVIHPNDLLRTRQEKDGSTQGLYLGNPFASLEDHGLPANLWGMTAVVTTSIPEYTGLVINPDVYGSMVYRQPAILEINPYDDGTGTGWATNTLGLRAEWWGNLGCIHPKAACAIDFES